MGRCERCREDTQICMSYFSCEMICGECENKERQHPKYQEARAAEAECVKQGNYNFSGIGKPPDLR